MTNVEQRTLMLHRRSFLKSVSILALAGAAGIAMTAPPALAAEETAASQARFLHFSQFITGQTLDPVLAARYLKVLAATDANFTKGLDAAIDASAAFQDQGIDAMLKTLDPAHDVYATIRTVTSAWFLGVVGDGKSAQLIAFYDALMFKPTWDYVFVPTYGGGPNSWVSEKHV